MLSVATSPTSSTSSAPSTPPVLPNIPTVPGFTPINTDLAPEKSFLRELCTKVANHWTSTFHSSRHLDNLEKVGQFIPKMQEPIAAWAALVTSTANTPVGDMIAAVGGTVGTIITKGAEAVLATIDKFDKGLEKITGCDLSTLTPEKRRELSTEQRAKVSALYTSLKDDLKNGEDQFNQIGTELNGVSTAISALLEKDAEIAANFKQKIAALDSTEINALAPELLTKLNNSYSQNQRKIFNALAESAEAGPDAAKITEAATAATTALEETQKAMDSFVASVNAAVETVTQNKKIRDRLTDNNVPKDNETVVTVAKETFDAVKNWFNGKADTAETEIKQALESASLDTPEAPGKATETFAKNSQEYRNTVQAIGMAILPFDTLAKTEGASDLFKKTVGSLKDIVEKATVAILTKEGESHAKMMDKLQKLQERSASMAKEIEAELSTDNNLTTDEAATLLSTMTDDVSKIITPNRFSKKV